MFSHLVVILFTGGDVRGGRACVAGGMCGGRGGGVHGNGGMHGRGCVEGAMHCKGACVVGGHACSKTATEGGGTHPTGMHSCFVLFRC